MNSFENIPDSFLNKWQGIADLLAKIINIPAALIMKTENEFMEVFISSQSENNPYNAGDKEHWHGLYCETVIKKQKELLIPNALKDKDWDKNPDIKLGMIAYLGVPLNFPDKTPFGTICVLDSKENNFTEDQKKLLEQFKNVIEVDLALIQSEVVKGKDDIISELLSKKEEMQLSRDKLWSTLDQLLEGCQIIDFDYKYLYLNEVALKHAEIPKEKLIGKTMWECYPGIEKTDVFKKIKSCLEERKFYKFENEFNYPSGESRWFQLSIQPSGYGASLLSTDITDKVFAEKKLKELYSELEIAREKAEESEEHFSTIFKMSQSFVCIADINTATFKYVNPTFTKILGFSEEELISEPFTDFIHPDDVQPTIDVVETQLQAGNPVTFFENRYRCKNGEYRWLAWNSFPKPEKGITYAIAHDITDRKIGELQLKESNEEFEAANEELTQTNEELLRAKEKAQESEEKLSTIFNLSQSFIGIANIDTATFTVINPMFKKILGYEEEEMTSKPFLEFVHPEDQKQTMDVIEKELKSGKPVISFENRYLNKSGNYHWISWNAFPKTDQGVLYAIGHDITENKKSEQVIKQNNLRLLTLKDIYEMSTVGIEEIYDFTLEKAVELCNSKIGFIGFLNEDETVVKIHAWSGSVMKACAVKDQYIDFEVASAGIWGEVIRNREPIIINDFRAPNPLKRGLPEGHVGISNYLSIPVFDDNKIVSVIAVGNKEDDYTDSDLQELNMLMQGMWNFVKRRINEKELLVAKENAEESEIKIRGMFQNTEIGLIFCDPQGQILEINNAIAEILGSPSIEATKQINLLEFKPLIDVGFSAKIQECIKDKEILSGEIQYTSKWDTTVYMKYQLIPMVIKNNLIGVWINLNNLTDLWESKKQLEESRNEIILKNNLSNAFILSDDDQFYKSTLDIVLDTFNCKFGYFGFINHDGDLVCPSMTYDVWDQCEITGKSIVFPKDVWTGIWGESLKEKKSVLKNEGLKLPDGHVQLKNALAVPILLNNKLIGQIVVADLPGGFSDEHKKSLEDICNYISPLLSASLTENYYRDELIFAKEKAEESEARLLEAQRLSHVGNWEYEIETDTVTWSKELYDIFERSYDLPAPNFMEQASFYTKESYEKMDKAVQDIIQNGTSYEIDLDIITSQGGIKHIISKGRVKKDDNNNVVSLYGTAQDVTAQKELEKEILTAKEKAEKNLKKINEQNEEIQLNNERLEGLLRISQYQTENLQDLLDYALSEAIRLTHSEIGYIYYYNEDTKQFSLNTWSKEVMKDCEVMDPQTVYDLESTGCWGEAVRQRKPIVINDYAAKNPMKRGTPKGHVTLKKFLTIPLIFDNEIVAVVGVANKETDYNNADVRQLSLLMDSVWKISERIVLIKDLKEAKEKAEKANRLKTEFLHNMSHEVRTPMNGILGFSKMFDKTELSEEKRKYYAKIVQNSSQQLLKIIDDILEISNLETKQEELNETSFALNDLIMELFTSFEPRAKERNIPIYLKKALHDDQSFIVSDKMKVSKISQNLLDNAIKYTNKGSIEVGYYTKDEMLTIYVKDTGIGIAPENHQLIFERFSQENKEISKKLGGLGLGLSISKEMAQILGGDITLESEKGKGSTFYLNIPYNPSVNGESDSETITTEAGNQDQYTILIAEDEEINYLYIEALFEDEIEGNFNLIHAKNGKEAVDICMENSDIHLVLMDIKMPVMSGHDATKLIKEKLPDLPIVVQTAYSTEADRELAFSYGCYDFITKPLDNDKLFEMLKKFLKIK
jgi:PAS domain S-box-containing protein